MHAPRIFVALVMVGVLASCTSTPKPETGAKIDRSIDMSSYRTFAWISDDPLISAPARALDRNKERIERAIVAELTSRGFEKVEDRASADFVVAYSVGERRSLSQGTVPDAYQSGWRMDYGEWVSRTDRIRNMQTYGSSKELNAYTSNSLVIDIFDVATKSPAWHGFSSMELTGDNRRNMEATINAAVADIMSYFKPNK